MASLQEVAAEALKSALWRLPFSRLLGERPDPNMSEGEVHWFILMEDPGRTDTPKHKQVMVSVGAYDPSQLEGVVQVDVYWLNVTGAGGPVLGSQQFLIPTMVATEADVRQATEEVMVRVLEILDDVLRGEGVAGSIDKIAASYQTPGAGEIDPETDMAVDAEEFE